MSVVRRALVLVLAAAAATASAQQPPPAEPPPPAPSQQPESQAADARDRGFTFAARVAWVKPHGIVAGLTGSNNELPLDREFSSGAQFTLETGYRFPVGVTAGLFVQYGFVSPGGRAGNGLCETASCTEGRTLKYGVEVLYHFLRDRRVSPFVGAAFGRERSGYRLSSPSSESAATGSATIRYEGWQWIDAQVGADWAVAPRTYLGAFVSNSFGRYDKASVSGGAASFSGDLAEKKVHSWLQVGMRLGYDL